MKSEKKRIKAALKRNVDIQEETLKARALFASVTAIALLKADEKRNSEDVDVLIGNEYETGNHLATLHEMFSEMMDKIEQGESDLVVKMHHQKTA